MSETKTAVDPRFAARLRALPGLLLSSARLVPEIKDGKPLSIRLFGVRKHNLWGAVGFQNGDALKAINGQDAYALFTSGTGARALRRAPRLALSLERRGKPLTLELSVLTPASSVAGKTP